jgi:phosphoribosylformylglycinamidine synthase subunit PurS
VTHTFRVTITRKSGLSDPEGATTRKALVDLGFEVGNVSFGRIITVEVDAPDVATGSSRVEAMCGQLLANPVMENFTIEEAS